MYYVFKRLNNTEAQWSKGNMEPSVDGVQNMASYSNVTKYRKVIEEGDERAKDLGFSDYLDAYNVAAGKT